MKDIVISSKKIERIVKRELKNQFGKVPTKVQDRVLRGVNNIIKDKLADMMDEIPTSVDVVVQSNFSLEDIFPEKK